jgi:hypothetical protein
VFIPVSIGALVGVRAHDAGVASGLIDSSQQLGGAIGIAVASTVAAARSRALLGQGHAVADALAGGFHGALWVCGLVGLAAVPVAFLLVRPAPAQLSTDSPGYTPPHGLNILALQSHGSSFALARYSLTGKLLKVLVSSKWAAFGEAYAPDGATLAVAGPAGVGLVSNVGGVIRQLDVPGTDPTVGCTPERWWNASTILAACIAKSTNSEPRLWLLPASGARPTALTPQRKAGHDLGDFDAWRLTSGLYLQSEGACGVTEINRQAANGSVTPVNVPGTSNTDNVIPFNSTENGPGVIY